MKSGRTRLARHVERIGERKNSSGNPIESDNLKNVRADKKIILKLISKRDERT
jgi:hypothetical protein